jgi:hypothetical protein
VQSLKYNPIIDVCYLTLEVKKWCKKRRMMVLFGNDAVFTHIIIIRRKGAG